MAANASIKSSSFLRPLRPSLSSSSIADMKGGSDAQKLRVLVASNGSKDVAQALALVVRLSKNPKIETKAIVDDGSYRLSQETLTLPNKSFLPEDTEDESRREVHRQNVEYFQQQAFELCNWADMLVLAPIDAGTLGKMLHGITDNLLLEVLRGWDISKKILLVPGMTTLMWENPMTKKQLSKLRRKWKWVRVMPPILWHYDEKGPAKCFVGWDGFNELVDVIKNQAELMTIGHDVDIVGTAMQMSNVRTETLLPPEIWSVILEYVGDWEISRALNVYANIPTPPEWRQKPNETKDELQVYMRSLEWTILTSAVSKIIDKLQQAPENMRYLSSLCVKLIIKFCLTDLLTYLETNFKDVFWASFGQKLLPTKASAVYGRTAILEWWRTSPTFLSKDYTAEAIDGASKAGFVHVLDWWRKSGLALKYTEAALEQASAKGHILVLEWWKEAAMHPGGHILDPESNRPRHGSPVTLSELEHRSSSPSPIVATSHDSPPPLRLKPGKSLLAAAQHNQHLVLRWWDNTGIPLAHSESVARTASAYGHVEVLDTWRELKGDKMAFDSQVLVGPTKNGHVEVLEWWKCFAQGEGEDGTTRRVEYKTCDIEEALEDCIGSEQEEYEVRKWWARNGLNLGVEVSEWTKVKVL